MFNKLVLGSEKLGLFPYIIGFAFCVWAFYFLRNDADALFHAFQTMFRTAPIWLPPASIFYAYEMWMKYIRFYEDTHRQKTVIEIKLPADITQSPQAMEVILNVMYHTDESTTFIDKYWKGTTAPWFSLEIVSMEGNVHFYVWMRSNYKNIVESQFYAHYPGIEINEVPDYTKEVIFDVNTMNLWGIEQKKQNADPYPILTYVDFGLDKDPKEEFKIDPIHSIIEFLGSIGKGEFLWTQIVIRSHSKHHKKHGTGWFNDMLFADHGHWNVVVNEEIQKILSKVDGELIRLTEGEKNKIAAMQRNETKKPFDVGMRAVYIDRKEVEHNSRNNGIPTMYRSFEHASEGMGYNGLKPQFVVAVPYKLRDLGGAIIRGQKKSLYHEYRFRSFFFHPVKHKHNTMVMSAEEIATLYHLPGRAAATPTLERITSRRAAAPFNLPV